MTAHAWELVQFAGYGAVSALVGSMAKSRRLELPRLLVERKSDGEVVKVIDLGFLVAPIAGAIIAAVVDGRPQTALAYGLCVGWAGPSVLNAVIDPLLKRFGLDPDVDPLKSSLPVHPKEVPHA